VRHVGRQPADRTTERHTETPRDTIRHTETHTKHTIRHTQSTQRHKERREVLMNVAMGREGHEDFISTSLQATGTPDGDELTRVFLATYLSEGTRCPM
jgi:hypothetical protein